MQNLFHARRSLDVRVPQTWVSSIAAMTSRGNPPHHFYSFTQRRFIAIPRQLKAYGDEFFPAQGDRTALMNPDTSLVRQRFIPNLRRTTVADFSEMNLDPRVVDALADQLQIVTPSPVQQMAVPAVANSDAEAVLIASSSGSGKTAAYLAPVVSSLLRDRDVLKIPLRERRPRAVICAPTKELCRQIARTCKALCQPLHLTVRHATTRKRANRSMRRMLQNAMPDILVVHPTKLMKAIEARRLFIDDLRFVVLDEADTLLGVEHGVSAQSLLRIVDRRRRYRHLWRCNTRTLLVSSCITPRLKSVMRSRFRHCPSVCAPGLHTPPPSVAHRFQRIKEHEKLDALRSILHRMELVTGGGEEHRRSLASRAAPPPSNNPSPTATSTDIVQLHTSVEKTEGSAPQTSLSIAEQPTLHWEHVTTTAAPVAYEPVASLHPRRRAMVFFKSIDRCTAVYHALAASPPSGLSFTIAHGTLPIDVRNDNISRWLKGEYDVLLTTDLLSRGIDTYVPCIINFDAPPSASSYLLRVGRAGRMGRRGVVHTFATKHDATMCRALQVFVKNALPQEGIAGDRLLMRRPQYSAWVKDHTNHLARQYVSMLSRKRIPKHLERTYVRHNAMWRPPFRPETIHAHGGVHPLQQEKIMAKLRDLAVWHRREQMAQRKGGRAKFGRVSSGVWSWRGAFDSPFVGAGGSVPTPREAGLSTAE